MRKEITFDNFTAMCDRLDEAYFKCGQWWPTIQQIKEELEPKIEKNLEFLIWISETAEDPITEEQKASKKYINKLINETLIFTD